MNLTLVGAVIIWLGWFLWAILRVLLWWFVNTYLPHTLPLWTLFVNVLWSFIIWIVFWIAFYYHIPSHIKSFIISGFLWALTTFSTFAMESFFMLDAGKYKYFILNVWLNVILTILFAAVGFYLIKLILK